MPGFIAKKLCPNLVIVPTNFDKYRAVSEEVRATGMICRMINEINSRLTGAHEFVFLR